MLFSAPCERCQEMGEECVPRSGVRGALACQRCARRKARCSHVGPSAGAAASANVADWQAAMREGAAMVADAMDRQTEALGELASEVYGLRQAVERLSSSSASSLRGAMSGGDTGQESVWDGEDEEMEEGEGMWRGDEMVKLAMRGEDEESDGDVEEDEDEGGKHDEEGEGDGDDEEGEKKEEGADDEEEEEEEEGADDEGGAEPEASTVPWRPRVPHPKMKVWKGKGKAVEKGEGKGKGKGKGKMY